MVTINELITEVNAALNGCPTPLTNLPIAGSWLLVFRNSGGGDAEELKITSAGSVAIRSGLISLPTPMESTGQIVVLDSARRIYGFQGADGLTAAVQFSADGTHGVYIDEFGSFGALEHNATAPASSYSDSDLTADWFAGTAVSYQSGVAGQHVPFTVSRATDIIADTFGQPRQFTVVGGELTTGTQSTPLQISSDQALAALGVFSGDASLSGNPADVHLILSPDKTFAAVEVCSEGSDCLTMDWARQTGSYAKTCQSCTGSINAAHQALLTCACQNSEGQIAGTTSLPLPCGGTIDNLNGTLTCR